MSRLPRRLLAVHVPPALVGRSGARSPDSDSFDNAGGEESWFLKSAWVL
jgi:hypothetical protein